MESRKKILVAHPLRDMIELLGIYLQKKGYDGFIFLTTDGEAAADFLKKNIRDILAVVVSDMLPRLAGLDIAKLTKALARVHGLNIPVIIVTALSEELGNKHWKELREISDGRLLEPFDFQQFEEEFEQSLAACR